MRVLDLFCGAAGGWSAGLARAGFRTVAACELDPWRRAVFAANHPQCRMYDDVRDLTAARLRADLGYLPEVVVGSPPCQEISAANSKGTGITDDHLFWDWARLVFEIRPVWCAAENSPRSRTEGIDGVLDALDQAGYATWPIVVGADHAGANHRRRRLWLIAADADRLGGQPGGAPRHPAGQGRGDPGGPAAGHSRDAERVELRQQPRRRGRTFGAGAAVSTGVAGHAAGVAGVRFGGIRTGGRAESAQAGVRDAAADADCESGARFARSERQPRSEIRHHALPAELRRIGESWPHWNGGLPGLAASCAAAGFGALDDGSDAGMAPGLRNRAIAALGDAVVPQIPEAIGRAIMEANQATPDMIHRAEAAGIRVVKIGETNG